LSKPCKVKQPFCQISAEYSAPTSPCPGGSSIVGDVMTDNNTDSIDDKEELNPETTENQVNNLKLKHQTFVKTS